VVFLDYVDALDDLFNCYYYDRLFSLLGSGIWSVGWVGIGGRSHT
jgi:hypothetical protein